MELVEGGQKWRVEPRTIILVGLLCTLASASLVLFGSYADSKTVSFVGTILALLSFGVMVTGAFLADAPRRNRRSTSHTASNDRPQLAKAVTTNRLQPSQAQDHFRPSVTEQTTTKLRLL